MSQNPFLSIIIPTYNRPLVLGQCLSSLANLDYPNDYYEIIVVDDGSSPAVESQIKMPKTGVPIRIFRKDNGGPASARNHGANQARGEYLVFTDDDCITPKDWLDKIANRLKQTPDAAIAGRTTNLESQNYYATACQDLLDSLHQHLNRDPNSATFATSNNLIVPRDKFLSIGGFDLRFKRAAAEDRELVFRWNYFKNQLVYDSNIMIAHHHRLSLKEFLQQHFNYGRGAHMYYQICRELTGARFPFRFEYFYSNLLFYPFSHRSIWAASIVSLLLVLSQAVNVLGFLDAMLNTKRSRSEGVPSKKAMLQNG